MPFTLKQKNFLLSGKIITQTLLSINYSLKNILCSFLQGCNTPLNKFVWSWILLKVSYLDLDSEILHNLSFHLSFPSTTSHTCKPVTVKLIFLLHHVNIVYILLSYLCAYETLEQIFFKNFNVCPWCYSVLS